MKRRIISVVLALCLTVSFQSVASAENGDSLSPEEFSWNTEESSLPPAEFFSGTGESSLSPEEFFSGTDEVTLPPAESFSGTDEDTLSREILLQQEEISAEESISPQAAGTDGAIPTPAQVYAAMIALKDQEAYKEGTPWTNDEPYSDTKGYYHWQGGTLDGKKISAVGCVAFAFILSDAAFGSLPARRYAAGGFSFEDIKPGDILQVNGDAHTVIVLEVNEAGVIVAEGNISTGDHQGKVHWERGISREDVMSTTSHYITRYPEGYDPSEDPDADRIIANGTLEGGLAWNLTNSGTLTVSGNGSIPDYSSAEEQPWYNNSSQIRTVRIEDGVTGIGACAFWNCGVLSVKIPSSVTSIGNNAFRGSSLLSVTIPSGVKTIQDSAFRACPNLSSAVISEGVETISQNAFSGCKSLKSIALPSTITEVGNAAFFQCQEMTTAAFAPGETQVKLGDNLFTQCYNLMTVTLPKSIDRIGEGMFQDCLLLPGLEIPQGAESIGTQAFASSGVKVILIPHSVTTIEPGAFGSCSLTKIYYTGTEAQWNRIGKSADTIAAVSKAEIIYEYSPEPSTPPAQTPEPSASPDPSAPPTQAPEQTATPEPTALPTQAPEQTAAPEPTAPPTQAPEQTAAPEPTAPPTQAPEQTAAPEPTAPPTQTPGQTAAPDPAPTPTVPSIKGESGKEGWAAITEEAVNAPEGKQVNVTMNGTSVVPGDVLDSVKGQNVTISFDMGNGIVWSVNGRDVTADHANDVDLSVQVGTSAIPEDVVNHVAGNRRTIQLSLAHDGDFGYKAVLTINVDSAYAGMYANLFYYNERLGRLEFVTADQINQAGIAELVFTHASDYCLVMDGNVMDGDSGSSSGGGDESTSPDENDSQGTDTVSPKTGEDGSGAEFLPEENHPDLVRLLLIGAVVLAASAACLTAFRRTGLFRNSRQ